MPSFGSNSSRIRLELHADLRRVVDHAIRNIDFSLICGYRNQRDQERAFASGASRAHFGQSPHNFKPARAFDFLPYPFAGWSVIPPFDAVGREILASSVAVGVPVTWGKTFKSIVDYPHFELRDWRSMR